jgi:predicted negative regulator of RcsB-dependent stress response
MSTYDLEEQEQLESLKGWWKENGNLVLTVLTVALAALAAWNAWSWYRDRQSLEAASLYEVLEKAARANDLKAAREVSESLLEKYPGTSYGPLAALVSAKLNFQSGDAKTAKAQLQWVLDHARSDELKAVGRLRLAHVLVDEKAFDEALKVVDSSPPKGFEPLFEALRGDIFLVQKKKAEARAAYRAALDKADKKDFAMRQQLQLKIDALGEG